MVRSRLGDLAAETVRAKIEQREAEYDGRFFGRKSIKLNGI